MAGIFKGIFTKLNTYTGILVCGSTLLCCLFKFPAGLWQRTLETGTGFKTLISKQIAKDRSLIVSKVRKVSTMDDQGFYFFFPV